MSVFSLAFGFSISAVISATRSALPAMSKRPPEVFQAFSQFFQLLGDVLEHFSASRLSLPRRCLQPAAGERRPATGRMLPHYRSRSKPKRIVSPGLPVQAVIGAIEHLAQHLGRQVVGHVGHAGQQAVVAVAQPAAGPGEALPGLRALQVQLTEMAAGLQTGVEAGIAGVDIAVGGHLYRQQRSVADEGASR